MGDHLPDGPEFFAGSLSAPVSDAESDRRERATLWADEEFAAARTELFLAALALHKAFISAEAARIKQNLSALTDILNGKGRPPDRAVLAVWQTFFIVVPVVSTTFASLPALFGGLGRESLGWLFIDEAGQASPQQAVGALWLIGRDYWYDVRSTDSRGHWIPAEGAMLRQLLTLLRDHGRPAARTFATETPNLLNVAVTRARRRLYVIGNQDTWGKARYFDVLAGNLEVWRANASLLSPQAGPSAQSRS